MFGEEDLAVVSLETRVIYRRNGFPLGCQTKKPYSGRRKEDRQLKVVNCVCVWGGIQGLWHRLLAFFYAAGILFHLKIREQVLKVTCGLRVSE